METTVEGFCSAMSRCQFLPPERIRELRQRWLQEAGDGGDQVDRFTAWLVARAVATEYQIGVLSRGNGGQLTLGPYRILERIGRGRMAGVYKATHPTGATVAIKILPPSKAAQPPLFARFQREARLALSVKHVHVVRTFHAGKHRSLYYLVMEHLEGETLEELLARRKRLPVAEAVALVRQALLGLQAIHEQGLVHRDLNPGNLMLVGGRPRGGVGAVVKILDLGMGRALFEDDDGPGGFDLTRPGETLGAADYLSPEQARDAHAVDIRADVYALGCVLYHALAGEPPFRDASPVRQLLRHATEEPRPVTEHNPEVPTGLRQVLDWMLAKDPARRYPTPVRAAQALEMFAAANDNAPGAPDACAKVYLEWVESLEGEGYALALAADDPPGAPAAPVSGPKQAPSAPPGASGTGRAVAPLPEVNVEPVEPPLARPKPPPKRELREGARPPRISGRVERADEKPPPQGRGGDDEEEPGRVLGMTPRELLVLTVGLLSVVGLAVLTLLGWLAFKLFR